MEHGSFSVFRPELEDALTAPIIPPLPAQAHPVGSPWPFDAAAEFLAVSARHLMRLADAGKVKTIRIGRRRLIPDFEMSRMAREGC